MNGKKLRDMAGHFATGITVISVKNDEGHIHGMTANSFLSVSLDPPLVLFSLKNESHLFDMIKLHQAVGISFLSEEMEIYSNHFAGRPTADLKIAFKEESDAMILDVAEAWYSTKVEQIIPAGDHHLILCKIVDFNHIEAFEPLIYFKGYKKLKND